MHFKFELRTKTCPKISDACFCFARVFISLHWSRREVVRAKGKKKQPDTDTHTA